MNSLSNGFRSLRLSLAPGALLLVACASQPVNELPAKSATAPTPPRATPAAASGALRASDYGGACQRDQDCVAIYEGDGCQACRCANAAIARSDYAKYQHDLQRYAACYHPEKCGADCIEVAGGAAVCQAGHCALPNP